MNRFLLPAITLSITLVACTPATPDTTDVMTDSSSSTATTSSSDDAMSSSGTAAAETRVIEVAVKDWSFTPSVINVRKGEKVVIRLSDEAGIHSFGIKDFDINVALNPGETKDVSLPTDVAGTFEFRCMIPCGPGHKDMKGTIVIS